MPKKFYIFILLIIFIFSIFLYRIYFLAYKKSDYYQEKYNAISNIYIMGETAPRGKILDINKKVLVDNIGVNSIFYHKSNNVNELEIAKKLVLLTNYEYKYDENVLKDYYILLKGKETDELITKKELKEYNERKLSSNDLYLLKKSRITEEMIDSLSEIEKYSSYFYYLMCDGYSYQNKKILEDITDDVYAKILEENIPGIIGEVEWKRNYLYGDVLKSIYGSLSNNLPKEKIELLDKGYSYNDKIGISGLEEYYEEYLKGEKAIYKVNSDNTLTLVKEAKRGADLILEIDIDLELKVIDIIKEQIIKAKQTPNTEFYKESYALISSPDTGAIKAIAGVRYNTNNKNYSFQDVSINVIKNAYTVGSVVKAASMSVGYQNNIIDIGTSMKDSCVKLYSQPKKCSYKSLGVVNDLTALTNSSNYYQFIIALLVSGNKYKYNMKANVSINDFKTYRDTFASYGLGTTTGIDLPNESIGLVGNKVAPDLLLNFAIGQYDLYTPSQMLQYINTIANSGKRIKLNLMHEIQKDDLIVKKSEITIMNEVDLDDKYIKRIQSGLRDVIKHGTGYYYRSPNVDAAGKTGTSESYIDSDNDGTLESFVISNTFLMYAPYDNPKYSLVVISPNTSNILGKSKYRSQVNRLITREINDYLFE